MLYFQDEEEEEEEEVRVRIERLSNGALACDKTNTLRLDYLGLAKSIPTCDLCYDEVIRRPRKDIRINCL